MRKIISGAEERALDKEEVLSIDAIANINEDEDGFQVHPDIDTPDQLFNGTPFKDLPYVMMVLHKNNTKLHALYGDKRPIWSTSPAKHGFKNAKKRTNIAGQVAGLNMGQKLRGMGIRTIRLRINGFNTARLSTVQGLVQAGITIVAIQDVTYVDWGWTRRAPLRPRKN